MNIKKSERGQSIIIIVIAFLGLVAVAGLIIDGGSLYLNRRNAQTAADAAAMAGAYELCKEKGSDSDVQNVVNQFAITENGATSVEELVIDRTNRSVSVTTGLETSSFFASVLGFETNSVRAKAEAGCFNPRGSENLLPISWACQPPIGGTPGTTCVLHTIPWELFRRYILPAYGNRLHENGDLVLDEGDGLTKESYADGTPLNAKMPYLIMDTSTQTDEICAAPFGSGTVDCDWNDDGIPDLSGGGDRGWLRLDGTGAALLKDLIVNGYSNPVDLPQWFPVESGSAVGVFIEAKGEIEDEVALVPVYNAFCLSTTSSTLPTDCVAQGYQSTDLVAPGSGSSTFYRVAGFAPFVVTCISAQPSQKCPVKTFAGLTGPALSNIQTIEGYFVSGYTAGTEIGTPGIDLGVYLISLTK